MTLGQRIAQKRKEAGLSQEALGEALGVSRQSVYKWESDTTLPEIDKLIALSRLFSVTVGWLLGVEEPERAKEAPDGEEEAVSSPDGTELTETQLKMVEEIVDRYLDARQPPKKRRWPWVAGAAAGLALLLALNSLRSDLRNMRSDYNNLQNSINSVSRNVDSQIYSITNRVEEVLKNQNNLAASYGAEVLSGDLAANTVTFSAHATPKTYTEGMSAVFVADNGQETVEVPAQAGPGQEFSAQVTCEMTDGITLSVVFVTGDKRETQTLESFLYLYSNSLPDVVWPESSSGMMWKEVNDAGELCWTGEDDAYLPNDSSATGVAVYDFGRAEVRSLRVGLFRNHALLGWLEPCEKPKNYDISAQAFFRFPELSVAPEEGDEFRLCTVAEDEFGREFVCRGLPYTLDREWGGLRHADGGEIGLDDPANWEY